MSQAILITGGVRSGKSRHALELAQKSSSRKAFIATAEALDPDMSQRIQAHRIERGEDFLTIEEPIYLSKAIASLNDKADFIIIDCLTLWMSNLMHYSPTNSAKHSHQGLGEEGPEFKEKEIAGLIEIIKSRSSDLIFVTNETGLGVMPDNPLARQFADELGKLNQRLAAVCDEVIFMISGIPQKVKAPAYAKLD